MVVGTVAGWNAPNHNHRIAALVVFAAAIPVGVGDGADAVSDTAVGIHAAAVGIQIASDRAVGIHFVAENAVLHRNLDRRDLLIH